MKKRKVTKKGGMTRREYLKKSVLGTAGLFAAPAIVPSTVFGKSAPSEKIHVAQIGFGRIARGHDLPETMKEEGVRVVAISEVDRNRLEDGKRFVEGWYEQTTGQTGYIDVQLYQDYREMLEDPGADIDAVIVSTPDHGHLLPVVHSAVKGKDIYLQKPHSLTVREGRTMTDILHKMGTVFQIGSQQRAMHPWPQFKRACELVRNGRIGTIHTIYVGLPGDPAGGDPTPMPVPENLDYDLWLGTTPKVPYTVDRVHPLEGYGRGGWLRCEQFSAGMITGWGAHHLDIAHWGMGMEYSGPIELEATAEFPTEGLWTVHGPFKVEAKYANGVTMHVSGDYPNGIRFEGDEGWIFVTRGAAQVTASDPDIGDPSEASLQASSPSILNSEIGPNELHLKGVDGEEHHTNWIRNIRNRSVNTYAPAEISHRSTTACLISHIAMKLPRKLYWDPVNERFKNDDEANAMLSRPQRFPYTVSEIPGLDL